MKYAKEGKHRRVSVSGSCSCSMIPGGLISVDKWNCRSKAYFLSHMHSDHTKGLSNQWCRGPLFCSSVTATLLLAKFPALDRSLIHVLPIGAPSLLPLSASQVLEVTAIDADHCPGSIMFVFRGEFGCIVHTGDFRWEVGGVCSSNLENRKQQLALCIGGSCVDWLFLDNTFCNSRFSFPPRHIAAQQVVDIITSYSHHDVLIGIDMLGKEELLVFIAKTLKTKIWIWPERLQIMKLLGLPDIFTTDTTATRIRAVPRSSVSLETLQMLNELYPTVAVIPTGLWCLCKTCLSSCGPDKQRTCCLAEQDISQKAGPGLGFSALTQSQTAGHARESPGKLNDGSVCNAEKNLFYVSYSLHSCLWELKAFVDFIKPVHVVGNSSSSFCNINPCHYFQSLCHVKEESSNHISDIGETSTPLRSMLKPESHFNLSSEVSRPEAQPQIFKKGFRNSLRKLASIRSKLAWSTLRKRRGGGARLV